MFFTVPVDLRPMSAITLLSCRCLKILINLFCKFVHLFFKDGVGGQGLGCGLLMATYVYPHDWELNVLHLVLDKRNQITMFHFSFDPCAMLEGLP